MKSLDGRTEELPRRLECDLVNERATDPREGGIRLMNKERIET
jgi:hypothetical protein